MDTASALPPRKRGAIAYGSLRTLGHAAAQSLSFSSPKPVVKKIQGIYRASGAPNTGKVIEIPKEKANGKYRAQNRKKQGAETGDASPGHIDPP
jgi:hypothetical protein